MIDEMNMRARLLEVLRSDPKRSVSDDSPTEGLVSLVCGDLVMAREQIQRLRDGLYDAPGSNALAKMNRMREALKEALDRWEHVNWVAEYGADDRPRITELRKEFGL